MKSLFVSAVAGLSAYTFSRSKTEKGAEKLSAARHALCIMIPHAGSGVTGLVSFTQEKITEPTKIVATIRGLKPNSNHGFHIHEFGDLTDGCTSAGEHFNPFDKTHGGPNDIDRHVGDMGNIKTDESGVGRLTLNDSLIKLSGEHTVIGRSCVVHADEDDLGRGGHSDSKKTGHSGPRLACGVIALSKEFKHMK